MNNNQEHTLRTLRMAAVFVAAFAIFYMAGSFFGEVVTSYNV